MQTFSKPLHERMLKGAFSCRSSRRGYILTMVMTRSCTMRRLVSLGLLAGALAVAAPLRADESDHDRARRALEEGKVLPLRTVLDKVEREYKGQAIKIEFEHEDGRFFYEIRLLQSDGRLVKLEVDAVNGKVLAVKRRER